MSITIEELEKKIETLERIIVQKDTIINRYEEDGVAKLFYSLNRKSAEMAELLNATPLVDINISDPKDKSFERIRFIINDSAAIATAVKSIQDIAGVIGDDEEKETKKKYSFVDSIAQKRD